MCNSCGEEDWQSIVKEKSPMDKLREAGRKMDKEKEAAKAKRKGRKRTFGRNSPDGKDTMADFNVRDFPRDACCSWQPFGRGCHEKAKWACNTCGAQWCETHKLTGMDGGHSSGMVKVPHKYSNKGRGEVSEFR